MAKDLDIRLRLDRAQAERSSQEFHQGERQRIAQLLTAEQVQAAARQQIIARTNTERVAAAVRAIQGERQELAKSLTQEEAIFQARNNLINRANQQRVAATEKALKQEQAGWLGSSEWIEKATGALSGFAMQMVGLNSITSVVTLIADEFTRAREAAFASAQMVLDYRKALLELAALKGQPGETTKTLAEDLDFRRKTLQSAADARAFQMAALGAGESAIDLPEAPGGRKITREEYTRAMEMAGTFQGVEQGSAAVHGRLIGTLANLTKGRTTGAEIFAREQQLYEIFKPGNFEFSSAANQFAALAPIISGGTMNEMDAGALLSMFSTISSEGAATLVEQFTRGTLGGIGRAGGPRIEGAEAQGQYLGRLGITAQSVKGMEQGKLPFEIGNRIAADIARARKEAVGQGETFDPLLYLMQHGFAAEETRRALVAYAGKVESGDVGTFLGLAAPGQLPDAERAAARFRSVRMTDPAGRQMVVDLGKEEADVATGAGQTEYLGQLGQLALNRRRARGEETTYREYADIRSRWRLDPRELLFGSRGRTEMEMQRMLEGEATRVGVPFMSMTGFNPETGATEEVFGGEERLAGLAKQIAAKGGNVLPGAEEVSEAAQRQLDAAKVFENGATIFSEAVGRPKTPPLSAANRTNPRTGLPE
jgi:hypothetical protein